MAQFPEAFLKRIQKQRLDAQDLIQALNRESPISIRLNPKKTSEQFENEENVPWCPTGKYLKERPIFTKDPLFHAGVYYPQEAGSMFIDAILKQLKLPEDCIALDLCAAPGGKSTILLDNLSDSSLLISNEINRHRAYILRDNLTRWGNANLMVTNRNPSDFHKFTGLFDLILVDAPCSGEGMFRKDPNSRNEWTPKNTALCATRQTEILKEIWPSLKEGGILIYSTCTFNPEENSEQILNLLETYECQMVNLSFPATFGLDTSDNQHPSYGTLGYTCFPHKMKAEGFFFSVIQKTEQTRSFQLKNKRLEKNTSKNQFELPGFKAPANHTTVCLNDAFYLIPENQIALMLYLQRELSCLKFGIRLGEVVGGKWNPHFEYALCHFDKPYFESAAIHLEQALHFLKGNAIDFDCKDGWCLVTYQNHALGWLKKIGNRANNYYPKELRIRMELQ
jgi:16S rRNA C967 or C1407 C5-methylase (RsmB/RsmF family)/NOL1/NOP2/fmu family ribosome biogenesis protein